MARVEIVGIGEYPVSIDYLVALQEYAAERGVPPQVVLLETGLALNVLIKPGIRVGHVSMDIAVRNVLRELDDPLLPIQYGRRLTISKHGVLGFAAQSSATLLEAAGLLEQYMKTRSGSGDEFSLIVKDGVACFRIYPLDHNSDHTVARFHILATLFSIETIARWLSGSQSESVPSTMRLAFSFPYEVGQEHLSPGLQIEFDAPFNELAFPLSLMERPLLYSSPSLAEAAREQCKAEMELLSGAGNIAAMVRQHIRGEEGRLPTLEQLADTFNMSSRTLKRRLNEAGTTYQHLKDSERFRKAITLLEGSRDSLELIAEQLGYSDASNFSKAFKSWSGMMPGEYRELH